MPRLLRRVIKGFAIAALIGAAGLGALLGSVWLERRTAITLPAPTGPFGVGRALEVWTDDSAVDRLAPTPKTRRELLVWTWYPISASPGATDAYVPAEVRLPPGQVGGSSIFGFLTRDLAKVRGHTVRNAALSTQRQAYPVLIMRGGASAGVSSYSSLAEDLASQGYLVVGFDAPYRTGLVVFPDGRVITRTDANNPELLAGSEGVDRLNQLLAGWTADIAIVVYTRLAGSRSTPVWIPLSHRSYQRSCSTRTGPPNRSASALSSPIAFACAAEIL